ncbi:hypothetical protein B0H13DRAFT_2267718 [Mycena leptocephala]|nr:hypothetical protein B0H13DRAFT_2267718 [Mycena leptocephala]
MSASYQKDRIVCAGVYKGPPNISKEALRVKVEAFLDSLLAVTVAQRNYVKFEIMRLTLIIGVWYYITDLNVRTFRMGWHHPALQTEAKFTETLGDPEFANIIREAEHLDYFSAFFADVVTKVDVPAAKNRVRVMGALKPPAPLSLIDFHHKTDASRIYSSHSRSSKRKASDYACAKITASRNPI